MSAPVTESHKRLVATIVERAFRFAEGNHKITPELSQLIADSEAAATDQLRAECNNLNNLLRAAGWGQGEIDSAACIEEENDKLRADRTYNHECINRLASATGTLGEKSGKVVDVALSTIDQLRAEVERLGHLEAVLRSSAADMTAGSITAGGVADLRAENERLRRAYVRPDDIRAQLESAIARAKLAEAELAEQKYIKRSAVKRANELTEELAAERARLDWLEDNAGDIQRYNSSRYIWSANQKLRTAIDAAMKEGAK